MRIPKWFRAVLDLTLVVLMVILFVTGIGLLQAPSGRITRETGWTFLGMERQGLEKLHTLYSYIFTGIVAFHFVVNWRIFIRCALSSLKTAEKIPFFIGSIVSLAVLVGIIVLI